MTFKLEQVGANLESDLRFIAFAGGIGALLWGMAADYFPARWLLIALAGFSFLATVSLWLPGGNGTDALILLVVRGGPDQPSLGADGGLSSDEALCEAGSGGHLGGVDGQFPGVAGQIPRALLGLDH